jgi:hypothetical protein
VKLATKGGIFVLTEDQRHRLMEYNRQWLLTTPIEGEKDGPSTLNPKELH